jgi:hypothetical protein
MSIADHRGTPARQWGTRWSALGEVGTVGRCASWGEPYSPTLHQILRSPAVRREHPVWCRSRKHPSRLGTHTPRSREHAATAHAARYPAHPRHLNPPQTRHHPATVHRGAVASGQRPADGSPDGVGKRAFRAGELRGRGDLRQVSEHLIQHFLRSRRETAAGSAMMVASDKCALGVIRGRSCCSGRSASRCWPRKVLGSPSCAGGDPRLEIEMHGDGSV